ncbi:DUF3318 domain-containing protein [Cupriavidus sp. 2MCAB6]|uniref:DUF3318 domain-containing protein n=1 Tax=Cupriavidus sp. 2MCAB6 TaxID=3232981 RepID=UPI003F915AAC
MSHPNKPDQPTENVAGTPHREHQRPVRFSREVRLPLAIRKELLITRAALERYDCAQALHHVRGSATRFGRFSTWLPRMTRPASWLKLLGLAKEYPLLSSAVSLALPLLRKTPVLRWTWKASKFGILAGAGYWVYQTWQKGSAEAARRAPPDTVETVDTGFRDPLVR